MSNTNIKNRSGRANVINHFDCEENAPKGLYLTIVYVFYKRLIFRSFTTLYTQLFYTRS